jgi:hypothetical protein
MGRELLWGDSEAIKLFSMRESIINKFNRNKLNDNEKFKIWLVGFTDGDGCFSVVKSGGTYRLQYSLSQSSYNLRILYYIKSQLGYGGVSKSSLQSWGNFRITDRKVLNQVIFPIFDKYPLLTSKYFAYLRFKKAYDILENKSLTTDQKNKEIEKLLSDKLPSDYISPAISHLSETSSYEEIADAISIFWLVGFTEAEANFCVYPDRGRFNIEFNLSHKLDKLLLQLIKRLLHISSNVNFNQKNKIYVLTTKNSRSISNIIGLFTGKLKGIKSLEFKLWHKANFYKDKNLKKVSKIHKTILKIQQKNNLFFTQKRHYGTVANYLFFALIVRPTKQFGLIVKPNKFEQFGLISKTHFIGSLRNISLLQEGNGLSSLNPYYVTGYSDGESSFSISIVKRLSSKIG